MSSDSELGIDTIDPAYHIVARQWANEAREANGGDSRPAAECRVGRIKWTWNGRGSAFIDATESDVWIQPFDDHPAQQVHSLRRRAHDQDFAWSPDGTRFAVARDIDDERHRAIQGLETVIGVGAR